MSGSQWTDEQIKLVWVRGQIIDPRLAGEWRLDTYGSLIRRDQYGLRTRFGWYVAKIRPTHLGGTDHPDNLQPLHWQN